MNLCKENKLTEVLSCSYLAFTCFSFQGHVGGGLEQRGLVEGGPAHGRGMELDDLKVPSMILQLYD